MKHHAIIFLLSLVLGGNCWAQATSADSLWYNSASFSIAYDAKGTFDDYDCSTGRRNQKDIARTVNYSVSITPSDPGYTIKRDSNRVTLTKFPVSYLGGYQVYHRMSISFILNPDTTFVEQLEIENDEVLECHLGAYTYRKNFDVRHLGLKWDGNSRMRDILDTSEPYLIRQADEYDIDRDCLGEDYTYTSLNRAGKIPSVHITLSHTDVESKVSTLEQPSTPSISIFPNPLTSSSRLHLLAQGLEISRAELVNEMGCSISPSLEVRGAYGNYTLSLPFSEVRPGINFLRVYTNKSIVVKQFYVAP